MKHIILSLLLIAGIAGAQTMPITWSGEVRFRTELDGRDFDLTTPMNVYTLSRVRLGALVTPSENIFVKITLQDSRTFGQEASTVANNANIDLFEGYVKIDKFLGHDFSLKFGRMSLSYGTQRYLGGLGWHNYGRVFDGLLIGHNFEKFSFDLIAMNVKDVNTAPAAVNAAGTKYAYDNGIMLYGLYSTLKFIDGMPFDFFVLHERNQNYGKTDTIDYAFTTLGGTLAGKSDALLYEVEGAFQLGSNNGVNHTAYNAAVMAGYAMQNSMLSSVSAHAEIISGTPSTSKDSKTFVVNYSTAHKFYGYMDYFINFPAQTFNRGLMDIYLRANMKFSDVMKLQLSAHNFSTMEKFGTTAPLNTTDLGQELDIMAQYKYAAAVSFEGGLSLFNPTTLMRTSFGSSAIGVWSYLTMQVNF